jgi:CheY-like chemotaxis protein/HPt (histidine-containing phosphotransfer) domain-containing protein
MNPHTQEENKKNVAMDILVAEDNRYNQDLVRHILTKAGHLVTMAQNGREALEILSRKVFSLILMDIQMPEMDGITATGIIRQIEKGVQPKFALEYIALEAMKRLAVNLENRHIPILAMTAFAMAEDKNKTIAAGMDGYVTKPFNPDEILETIQSLGSGLGQVTAQISHHLNSENHSSPPPLEATAVKKFLKESYHFSDEKIESMLLNLKTSLLEVFSRIEKSLTDKDAESLANALHNLKGVFYNIGSNDWAKLTQDAESRLRESEENNFEKLIKNLKRAVAQFIQ